MLDWFFTTISVDTAETIEQYLLIVIGSLLAGIAGWAFMQGATTGPRYINPWTVGVGTTVVCILTLSWMMT